MQNNRNRESAALTLIEAGSINGQANISYSDQVRHKELIYIRRFWECERHRANCLSLENTSVMAISNR